MKTVPALRVGQASDPGRERGANEDRVLANEDRGIFLVVDGLGGHAAGEVAAEMAVRAIDESLKVPASSAEASVRTAIAAANNRIYERAQGNEAWRGMACVLTLALVQDEQVTVGHVGDTRLYLAWNGGLRKITADHSPVGEQEDEGLLTAEEAMRHPRRNEIFRDVGSMPHQPDDADFIDVKRLPLRPDAALLICSDGLTDVLTPVQIGAIIDKYDGDAAATAQELIQGANAAGGKDNISVVFVAGAEFLGGHSKTLTEARPRHGVTKLGKKKYSWRLVLICAVCLLIGIVLGMLIWAAMEKRLF